MPVFVDDCLFSSLPPFFPYQDTFSTYSIHESSCGASGVAFPFRAGDVVIVELEI